MKLNNLFPENPMFDNKRHRCDTDCALFHQLGNKNEYDPTTRCRLCEPSEKDKPQ
jgi:hypothetical protein